MCGLAGYLSLSGVSEEICRGMIATLDHRGPDGNDIWFDKDVGIGLCHSRLAIQDLTSEGHQPMLSSSGRFVIVFNGEIYDFLLLKRELELEGFKFRGHSDTEVMLAAIENWGLEKALPRFVGMFAFALWDRKKRLLHLVRDRIGEKPLYYGWQGKSFLFASELKALHVHPAWKGEIDRNALTLYMRHNYIPAPYSIYKGIRKLMPGSILTLPVSSLKPNHYPNASHYWSVSEIAEKGISNPLVCSDSEAIDVLYEHLGNSIAQQMISDVPLGAFLSGGIDSSVVAALMQANSPCPINTFSIGFHEKKYNEAEHAKAVAQHLGTNHTDLYVTPEQAMAVIPKLPVLYDEPFSDSSQIPTFLVSELTRKYVTVALSGDGGDELFAGYNRYFVGRTLWNKMHKFPLSSRKALAAGLGIIPPTLWEWLLSIFPNNIRPAHVSDKLYKLLKVIDSTSAEELYYRLVSHWDNPSLVVMNGREPGTLLTDQSLWPIIPDFTERMMHFDMVSYLPDDILVKVDRAAMGVSLETRTPFLDHRLVEFSWRIPLHMKIRKGQGKWLLRQLLYRYVPEHLIDRPKMGFGVPIDIWLRGPLRDWAEDLLDQSHLQQSGYFEPSQIRKIWSEHLTGKNNWQYHLWDVLMFESWRRHWN